METKGRLAKIDIFIDMERYEEALEESRLLITEMPEQHIGYIYAGLCEYNLDHIAEAEVLVRKSLSIEPEIPFSLGLLARVQMEKSEHEAALITGNKMLGIDPEYVDGFIIQARSLLNLQNYEKARISIERGLALEPDNVTLLSLKVSYGLASNDLDYAKEGVDVALNKDPENPQLLLLYAYQKMESNDFKAAEIALHSAIMKDPNDESIRMALAECKKGKSWLFGVFYKYGFRRWTYEFTVWTVVWIIFAVKGFILVTAFFSIFMLLMWYGDVMYNSFLRLGKRSRYLLSKRKIVQSNFFLIANAITIALGICAYYIQIPMLWNLMIVSITANLIGISFFEMETKNGKISAAVAASIFILLQLLALQYEVFFFVIISLMLVVLYGLLFSFRAVGR